MSEMVRVDGRRYRVEDAVRLGLIASGSAEKVEVVEEKSVEPANKSEHPANTAGKARKSVPANKAVKGANK